MNRKSGRIEQAFLILTNKCGKNTIDFYNSIKKSTKSLGVTTLLYHQNNDPNANRLKALKKFTFTDDILTECGYLPIGNTLIPGNNHYPLLSFYINHPTYDFYWLIEDDVYFNGKWDTFFYEFNGIQHDFITSHIRFHEEEPNWDWWTSLSHKGLHPNKIFLLRSFNPIYRISNSALNFIHNKLLNHWQGHHEVLLPSLLYNSKYNIQDFGGTGIFVDDKSKNKYYFDGCDDIHGRIGSGTMRWRPSITEAEINDEKLYHPVKHDRPSI